MRKNKDGYVIIYVVFVVLFLCIVAVGTCTVALNNLKTQTAYIEQMQDRYEAEGAIEKFMADVCTIASGKQGTCEFASSYDAREDAQSKVEEVIVDAAGEKISLAGTVEWKSEENACWCEVAAAKKVGESRAVAEIAFSVNITVEDKTVTHEENGEEIKTTKYGYTISGVTSQYLGYSLENVGGDGE